LPPPHLRPTRQNPYFPTQVVRFRSVEYNSMNPLPNDIIIDMGGYGTPIYYYSEIDGRPMMHHVDLNKV
jgi:hypothetical protein